MYYELLPITSFQFPVGLPFSRRPNRASVVDQGQSKNAAILSNYTPSWLFPGNAGDRQGPWLRIAYDGEALFDVVWTAVEKAFVSAAV